MSRLLILVVLLASGASPATAGTITLAITSTVAREDGQITARARITNSGDEAARSVTPLLRVRGHRARGEARPTLEPKSAMDVVLTVPARDPATGRWPYELAIDYTDGNSYPFQALHVGLVSNGNPAPAKVVVLQIHAGPIGGSGTVRVWVKNLDGVDRRATVGLLTPHGLEATAPAQTVTLAAWGESQIAVPVINRSGLAGSRYTVFATVQYDDEGAHQAIVGSGVVEIVAPPSFFSTWRTVLWSGAVVLVLVWLGVVVRRATAPRARSEASGP